jgi:drug/metabolite transporter (DMT)-like permease
VEIVLALGSAIAFGVADFGGGVLSKKAHVFTVILLSQLTASVVVLAVLPFWDGVFSWQALGWGAAAGVAGMAGVAFLYRGLAIGRMGVVAPITAVLAAAIPVSFGLAIGERLGTIALIGVTAGLLAVVLIARTPAPVDSKESSNRIVEPSVRWPRGLSEAMGAGVGFGVFFILLERAPDESGLWPLVGTRLSIVPIVALSALIAGASFRPIEGTGLWLMALGVVNLGADLLYLLATRAGLLSLVAVITSLYPAGTVALARITLDERMVKQQMLGVGFAALSVTLIALR